MLRGEAARGKGKPRHGRRVAMSERWGERRPAVRDLDDLLADAVDRALVAQVARIAICGVSRTSAAAVGAGPFGGPASRLAAPPRARAGAIHIWIQAEIFVCADN